MIVNCVFMNKISLNYFQSLSIIAQQFISSKNYKNLLDEILNQVLSEVSKLSGRFDFAILAIKEKNRSYLKITNVLKLNLEKNQPLFKTKIKGAFLPLRRDDNLLIKVFKNKKSQINYSFAEILHPPFSFDKCERLQVLGKIKSNIIFPLILKKQILGVVIFSSSKKIIKIPKKEQFFLESLSALVAIAIENYFLLENQAKDKKELERANIKLKEIDNLKDEFISIASHELRTPMTAIKNYLWLILNRQKEFLNEKTIQYLDIAYKSSDRLISLVRDMLTLSRIEGNRFELRKESFNLEDLSREVCLELKSLFEEKNIKLVFKSIYKDLIIFADKAKITEVIQNILGNAIKFTPLGGKIIVSLLKKNLFAIIKIKDTGPGIDPNNQLCLFQKFSRVEHSYARVSQTFGTGLGLYISKKIIDSHNGDIKLQSELGRGCEFSIYLPVDLDFYFKKTK